MLVIGVAYRQAAVGENPSAKRRLPFVGKLSTRSPKRTARLQKRAAQLPLRTTRLSS
jgi:hypothetical protein